MNPTALETMQIFARCIICTFLYSELREGQLPVTWCGQVANHLLFVIIVSLLSETLVCVGEVKGGHGQ